MVTRTKREPPPEGGDPTATLEIGPSAAVSKKPQAEAAYADIISSHVGMSKEGGLEPTPEKPRCGPVFIRAPPIHPHNSLYDLIGGKEMVKREPPPKGGDPTATLEIGPSAAVSKKPQAEAAYTDIIPARVEVSNEMGFRVTVTVVGAPDEGERRRWLERLLFGRYRLDTILEEIDYPEPPSGVGAKPVKNVALADSR